MSDLPANRPKTEDRGRRVWKSVKSSLLRLVTTRSYRRRRARTLVEKWYEEGQAALRAAGGADRHDRQSLERDYIMELQYLDWQEGVAYTRELLRHADKLLVQVPARWNYSEGERTLTKYWVEGPIPGEDLYLSRLGIAEVRESIRGELRWRQESRQVWLPWVVAGTGLLGTITGLLAVARTLGLI